MVPEKSQSQMMKVGYIAPLTYPSPIKFKTNKQKKQPSAMISLEKTVVRTRNMNGEETVFEVSWLPLWACHLAQSLAHSD